MNAACTYDARSINTVGARFYSPALGRFLTPDWSPDPEPVPYADLSDPQSLNLYAYARNNPVTDTDPDGHWCWFGHIGNNCSKPAKLPVKEGGVAVIPADGILGGSLDVSTVLNGLQSMADAVTTGATTLVGGAVTLFALAQPANSSETRILAKRDAEIAADSSGAQDKKLTPGEIKKLEGADHDVHEIKRRFGGGTSDLYKDREGNIYVKPKGSPGRGEPIGVNINNVH